MGTGLLAEGEAVRDLEATMARFKGPPLEAFGLAPGADAAALRTAFMTLCKRYHPAKFARYTPPTVRLANEVFLVIRRAHDDLARALNPAAAPPRRTATPPTGVPIVPRSTPTAAPRPAGAPSVPPAPIRPTPTPPRPVTTASPTAARPAPTAPPAARPPAAGIPGRLRSSTNAPIAPASAAPTTRTAVVPPPAAGDRGPSLTPKLGAPPAADPRFERALEHLRERRWAEARPLLSELAAGAPTDVRYRAYLHYLRGWEAFEMGRDGEARAEWRRALACDPGLGMAQWALQKTGLG